MISEKVREILSGFAAISLDEIEKVKLMNRIDKKYAFSINRLPDLLNAIGGDYRVLEINGSRLFEYTSTYYDTARLHFYYQHVTGKLSRNKVRYRKYLTTGESFLEIKKKTNRNRTVKWRIEYNSSPGDQFSENAGAFLRKHISEEPSDLVPVIVNRFRRCTLVSNSLSERITIDVDLEFDTPDSGNKPSGYPYVCILEMKREGHSGFSTVSQLLKEKLIRPVGFSKYCVGTSVLYSDVKANRLKRKYRLLEKIKTETETTNNLT